jgi:hypothetical protein
MTYEWYFFSIPNHAMMAASKGRSLGTGLARELRPPVLRY